MVVAHAAAAAAAAVGHKSQNQMPSKARAALLRLRLRLWQLQLAATIFKQRKRNVMSKNTHNNTASRHKLQQAKDTCYIFVACYLFFSLFFFFLVFSTIFLRQLRRLLLLLLWPVLCVFGHG